jgi:predicted RNA-binding Zn-ribbon protein involved in translation (DUF1610 family)
MKNYKYSLENNSKKFDCPSCGKKTYVRYIDNETGNYLPLETGRCDRESKCGYHHKPLNESIGKVEFSKIPLPEVSYHSGSLLNNSLKQFDSNKFILFLKSIASESEVNRVVSEYFIGTSKRWSGATVFWQVDNFKNIRHGKIMLFDSSTGKRVKNPEGKSLISSVRSELKLKDFNLKQCLFGLHLIDPSLKGVNKPIALVEAEKTAIIMSLFKPEYTWLATGSKSGLKHEFLLPIKEFRTVTFPDKSEFNDWKKKADELNGFGFNIEVNDWLETSDYPVGTDLADVYLEFN